MREEKTTIAGTLQIHTVYLLSVRTGYKYELALVLNGTVPLPDLSHLEQQVFRTFRTPTLSTHSHTCTPSPLSSHKSRNSPVSIIKQATPLSPFTPPNPHGSPRAAKDRGTKDHFNYLLLDPRVLDRLFVDGDCEATDDTRDEDVKSELDEFRVFVESVFYVGKGKNSRSMQHLKDAKDTLTLKKTKVGHLLST